MPVLFPLFVGAVLGALSMMTYDSIGSMPKQLLIAPSFSAPTAPPCPLTFQLTAEQTKNTGLLLSAERMRTELTVLQRYHDGNISLMAVCQTLRSFGATLRSFRDTLRSFRATLRSFRDTETPLTICTHARKTCGMLC